MDSCEGRCFRLETDLLESQNEKMKLVDEFSDLTKDSLYLINGLVEESKQNTCEANIKLKFAEDKSDKLGKENIYFKNSLELQLRKNQDVGIEMAEAIARFEMRLAHQDMQISSQGAKIVDLQRDIVSLNTRDTNKSEIIANLEDRINNWNRDYSAEITRLSNEIADINNKFQKHDTNIRAVLIRKLVLAVDSSLKEEQNQFDNGKIPSVTEISDDFEFALKEGKKDANIFVHEMIAGDGVNMAHAILALPEGQLRRGLCAMYLHHFRSSPEEMAFEI